MNAKIRLFLGLAAVAVISSCLGSCTASIDPSSSSPSQSTGNLYQFDFDLAGGYSPSYRGVVSVTGFTKGAFFFDCEKEGVNFRGWAYNGTKIFDEKGNQLAEVALQKSMTFLALYESNVHVTIVTNIDGAGDYTGSGTYEYHTTVGLSATVNEGYRFEGWYFGDTLLSESARYVYTILNKDVTLEARYWFADYLLDVSSNNAASGYVLIHPSDNRNYLPEIQESFPYRSSITVKAYSLSKARFLGWYDEDGALLGEDLEYRFEMPNRNYSLEAKWNFFTVSYVLGGGFNNPENPQSFTLESEGLDLLDPSRDYYDFAGWTYHGETVTEIDPSWSDNVTLVAQWKAKDYGIHYELSGGQNSEDNPATYTVESDDILLADPSRYGYTFAGWFADEHFTNQVESIASGSSGEVVLFAKWIPVSYSLTYDLDGGTNNADNPETYTIESEFDFAAPSKDGFEFKGWFDEEGNPVSSISKGTTGPITLIAHWEALPFALSAQSEDDGRGSASIVSGVGYAGEEVTVSATALGNCFFKGWYDGETLLSKDATYTFTMPSHDYSLVARFYSEEEVMHYGIKPILSEDGQYVTYGMFPQTLVKDKSLIGALDALDHAEENGFYFYNGDYYASAGAVNDYSMTNRKIQDGTEIQDMDGSKYWCRCEPIRWRVLSHDGNDYSLLSEKTIYGCRLSELGTPKWKDSELRKWLNGSFYNSAFSYNNANIKMTEVDNSAPTTSVDPNPNVGENTNDRVFLLSYQDYNNASYGFVDDASRVADVSDYAIVKGVSRYGGGTYPNAWTRSPSSRDIMVDVYNQTTGAFDTLQYWWLGGVRPAMNVSFE